MVPIGSPEPVAALGRTVLSFVSVDEGTVYRLEALAEAAGLPGSNTRQRPSLTERPESSTGVVLRRRASVRPRRRSPAKSGVDVSSTKRHHPARAATAPSLPAYVPDAFAMLHGPGAGEHATTGASGPVHRGSLKTPQLSGLVRPGDAAGLEIVSTGPQAISSVEHAEEPQQQDDRQRDPQQPKQSAFHHDSLRFSPTPPKA